MLQRVADELSELKKWRRSLTMLLERIGSHHAGGGGGGGGGLFSDGDDLKNLVIGPAEYASIKAGFEKHMLSVRSLEDALNATVIDNVRHCIDLGIANPALLVATFVVIEQIKGGSEDEQEHDRANLEAIAQAAVHEAIVTRAQDLFQKLSNAGVMSVEQALSAASQVLQDLRTIASDVGRCMPKEFECITLAKNLYQSFLLVELERFYCSPRDVEDTMTILRLISEFFLCVRMINTTDHAARARLIVQYFSCTPRLA